MKGNLKWVIYVNLRAARIETEDWHEIYQGRERAKMSLSITFVNPEQA
mgnify:CR=1 FL=1